MDIASRHQCLIYEGSPSEQLPAIASVLKKRLSEGYRCLYLHNPSMVAGLRSHLAALGMDVPAELKRGSLLLSSELTLAQDGSFDPDLMLDGLEAALDQALADGFRGLFATGDMTFEFGPEHNFDKLVRYECKLEQLLQRRPELAGICQYHKDTMPADLPRKALLTHQTVFMNEGLSRFNALFVSPLKPESRFVTEAELDQALTRIYQQRP